MQFDFFLFIFDSPVQIALVVGVVVLLFGSSKLPQLAKSLGESRRAFKDGMRQAEEEESADKNSLAANDVAPQINQMSDEALMEEMRRRAEVKQP
jgi:TatA/E family protein of Tat protein translocase